MTQSDEDSFFKKQVSWKFAAQNDKFRKPVDSLQQLREQTEIFINKYSCEDNTILCFIKDQDKFLKFEELNIEEIFNSQRQLIEIQLFYQSKKKEQEVRIREILRKTRMLKNQLDSRLENQAEGLFMSIRISNRRSTHQESKYKKTIKLWLMVSDPLISEGKDSIYKQEFDFQKYQELITDSFVDSINTDLYLQKSYLSHSHLKGVLAKHKNYNQFNAVILQVFTVIYQQNDVVYLSLESDTSLGLQAKMRLSEFLKLAKGIKNLYCIIFIGLGMRIFKARQKQIKQKFDIPIIAIGTFDIKSDDRAKMFLKNLHSQIFKRKSIPQCFKNAEKTLNNSELSLTNCCCLHQHQKNSKWSSFVKIIGCSVAHKILGHFTYFDLYKKWKSNQGQQISKLILNKKLQKDETKIQTLQEIKSFQSFECYQSNQFIIHQQKRTDFIYIGQQQSPFDLCYLYYPPEQEAFLKNRKGDLKMKIQSKIYGRERPKIVYEIVQELRKDKNVAVCVIGEARSGKYNSISLAEKYIKDRYLDQNVDSHRKKIFIQNFVEEFETLKIKQLKIKVDQKLQALPHNSRLVLNIFKINSKQHQKFEELVKSMKQSSNIHQQSKSVCFVGSSSVSILFSECKIVQIPKLTRSQLKYIIFRQFGDRVSKDKNFLLSDYLPVLQILIQKTFTLNKIPFLDLSQFIKNLNFESKKPDLKEIENAIESFLKRTKIILDDSKISEHNFWQFLGFIAQFNEGLIISAFNEDILRKIFKIQNIAEKVIQDARYSKNRSLPLYDVTEMSDISTQQNYRSKSNSRRILIRPQKIMIDYFMTCCEDQANKFEFGILKIRYFSIFFRSIVSIIECREDGHSHIYREGLFMFDINVGDNDSSLQDLKVIGFKQTKSLFKDLFSRHAYSFYNFLKELSAKKLNGEWAFIKTIKQSRLQFLCALVNFLRIEKIANLFLTINSNIVHDNAQISTNREQFFNQIFSLINLLCPSQESSTEEKILRCQIITIITPIALNKINFENFVDQTQEGKLLKIMIDYQKNKNEIARKKKQLYLLHIKIESHKKVQKSQKELVERKKGTIDNIGHLIQMSVSLLNQGISIVTKTRNSPIILAKYSEKLKLLILKLIIKKIVIKFQNKIKTSSSDRHYDFSHEKLTQQLRKYKFICQDKNLLQKQIILCQTYLRIQAGNINQLIQLKFKQNQIDPQVLQLYKEIAYKINPKSLLLQSQNVILFMKSRCMMVEKKQCCFVRKTNIIKNFLKSRLANKQVNLFFLHLSLKNFEMVSQSKATSILYLVLSVDTINNDGALKIVFENSYSAEEEMIQYSKFEQIIQKINFKFLILFGSGSDILAERLKKNIGEYRFIVVFSFQLPKKLSLSTLPQSSKRRDFSFLSSTISSFLQTQNAHRIMELIICNLITFLSRQKNSIVKKSKVIDIQQRAIKLSKQIIEKWYRNKNIDIDNSIQSSVQISEELYQCPIKFPQIKIGKLQDLTSKISGVPHNFVDEYYYELIGRVQPMVEIINYLIKERKCLIQVQGIRKTGKTQFLKEIGWFCQTRYFFSLGIYYFDIAKMRQKDTSIMEHLFVNKEEYLIVKLQKSGLRQQFSRNYLLILLDNFTQKDIAQNLDFFQLISHGPIAIIYSCEKSLRDKIQKETHLQFQQGIDLQMKHKKSQGSNNYSVNASLANSMKRQKSKQPELGNNPPGMLNRKSTDRDESSKKWRRKQINIDKLAKIQIICIALTHLRNRSNESYEQILKNIIGFNSEDSSSIDIEDPNQEQIPPKKLQQQISESQLAEMLNKIKKYQANVPKIFIHRNYQQYDTDKLLKLTDTVDKISIKINR